MCIALCSVRRVAVIFGLLLVIVGFLALINAEAAVVEGSICTAWVFSKGGGLASAIQVLGWLLILVGIVMEVLFGNLRVFVPFERDSVSFLLLLKLVLTFIVNTYLSQLVALTSATRGSGFFFRSLKGHAVFSIGNRRLEIDTSIKQRGSFRAVLEDTTIEATGSSLWKLTSLAEGRMERRMSNGAASTVTAAMPSNDTDTSLMA